MITYPVFSNFCKKRFSGILLALQISIFLVSSFIGDFLVISSQQKNETKKGNTLIEFKYLTFLLENRFVWRQRFQKKLDRWTWSENVFKENLMLQFSWLKEFRRERFLGDEHLTSSSTKTASTINFKLYTHVSKRLLHKSVPAFFLIIYCSFFIAIIWRALKACFAWKQLKVDYSKNISKEENREHGFVCLLVG